MFCLFFKLSFICSGGKFWILISGDHASASGQARTFSLWKTWTLSTWFYEKLSRRTLYPAKLSITTDGERKIFHNKTKFKQNLPMNPALQKVLQPEKADHIQETQGINNTRTLSHKGGWDSNFNNRRTTNKNCLLFILKKSFKSPNKKTQTNILD